MWVRGSREEEKETKEDHERIKRESRAEPERARLNWQVYTVVRSWGKGRDAPWAEGV